MPLQAILFHQPAHARCVGWTAAERRYPCSKVDVLQHRLWAHVRAHRDDVHEQLLGTRVDAITGAGSYEWSGSVPGVISDSW